MNSCLKITCFKTATYAVMHFAVAIAVAFVLTGSWQLALAIGLIEPFVQTIFFAIHERAWNRATRKREGVETRRERVEAAATPLGGRGVRSAAGN